MMEAELKVLAAAHDAWMAGANLRSQRRRFKDFTYGRQWGDKMTLPNGITLTEGEYARNTGRMPQTNNLIRQLVKSVIGRYRYEEKTGQATGKVKDAIADERRINSLDELDARTLEEFLISGCAIQRVIRERRPGRKGESVYVDTVSPERFFVNKFTDPRGWDIELVGMLHDMSLPEVLMRFAGGDEAKAAEIVEAFKEIDTTTVSLTGYADEVSFRQAAAGRCRVVEVWTLEACDVIKCHDKSTGEYFMATATQDATEQLDKLNRKREREGAAGVDWRKTATLRWRYRYFAPNGYLLASGDSPYNHGMHPFVVKYFPMTDGEVHSFVEDVIDQQRHINRLITMIDHIMGHSAKGVLLFPVGVKIPDMTWEEVVNEWTKVNGVIPYSTHTGDKPEQIVSNGADAGAHRMLELEMKLLEQVSGVSNALRGETEGSRDGAELFKSRVEASAISLLDLFGSFRSFLAERDQKIIDSRNSMINTN